VPAVPDVPAVRVKKITKRYGAVWALGGVTFDIDPGEVFALLGPNGAGKSTALRVLVTLTLPTSGRAEVFGLDVRRDAFKVRAAIGYVPQQLSVDGALTGRENVWLFAGLYDIPWGKRKEAVDQTLNLIGLGEVADRMASTYSGGMIRRLELAQALVHRPRLLVLDEPTVGLDPIARGDFWERIEQLREMNGTTVVLSTHYMDEAEEHAHRVALLHRGKLQALDTPRALAAQLGEGKDLEDVFRQFAHDDSMMTGGGLKDVRAIRRTARRVS
jgi:ABC-2 type transport system ATP-binding protein